MKNFILFFASGFLGLYLTAQTKTFIIHGTVKNPAIKNIEITYPANSKLSEWKTVNANVENGKFKIPVTVSFPSEINISYGNRNYGKNYFFSDTHILIDTAEGPRLIKSPVQDEYEKEFLPFFKANDKNYDSLQQFYQRNYPVYGRDFPKEVKDSAVLLQEKYYRQRSALLAEYIKRHPGSYVALWDIYYFISITPTHKYFDFEKLFSLFSAKVRNQPFINALKQKLRESKSLQPGLLFPTDFYKGYEIMVGDVRKHSQYFLIDFWYSRCVPCIAGFPRLREIYNSFHNKGFDIISISVDNPGYKRNYEEAIKKNNLTWNHIWDKNGTNAKKYNINAFPTYILVNSNGLIIKSDIQLNELEAFLKENL